MFDTFFFAVAYFLFSAYASLKLPLTNLEIFEIFVVTSFCEQLKQWNRHISIIQIA